MPSTPYNITLTPIRLTGPKWVGLTKIIPHANLELNKYDMQHYCLNRAQRTGLKGFYNQIYNESSKPIQLSPEGIGLVRDIAHFAKGTSGTQVYELTFMFNPVQIETVKKALEEGKTHVVSAGNSFYITA